MLGLLSAVTGLKRVRFLAQSKGVEVSFSGEVQGVGFRFTARALATRYNIGGWITNLSDGRVQLVAEGSQKSVNNFLGELKEEFKQQLTGVELSEKEPCGTYKDFQIKFSR